MLDRIYSIIKSKQFLSIDEFMNMALSANDDAYYKTKQALTTDFITAPEISQMFGEIIGLWFIRSWYLLNSPKSINLVELGAGHGSLIYNLLKTIKHIPELFANLNVQLLEINPYFIEKQRTKLSGINSKINSLEWITNVEQIHHGVTIFIANEFFDAMPIKQYQKIDDKWKEVVLILRDNDNLCFDYADISQAQQDILNSNYCGIANNSIVEISTQSIKIIAKIVQHIKSQGGRALIIDYGYDRSNLSHPLIYQSSLQAVKEHKYCDVLSNIGIADLSAHVDFYSLKQEAEKYNLSTKITSQKVFLLENGVMQRANVLKRNLPTHERYIIDNQLARLISPSAMGEIFKVFTIN